jgi:hypothetical protein
MVVSTAQRGQGSGVKQMLAAAGMGLLLCAAAALGTRTTLGLLSDSVSGTGSFGAGAVTLSGDASGSCAASGLMPGNSPAPCSITVIYGGDLPGYLALDVLIETQAGAGGTPLYNPGDSSHDLQVGIASTNPTVTYGVPTAATTCPSGTPLDATCYELNNEIVSDTAFTRSSGAVTFTTSVSLPANASADYRGGGADVILTVHAAQSDNNGAAGCTVGSTCSTVQWR